VTTDPGGTGGGGGSGGVALSTGAGAVASGDPALATPLQHEVGGDQLAILQDVDRAGERLDLDDTPSGTE
jgi:hypothetical protein